MAGTSTDQGDDELRCALQLVLRQWDAEQENARRLTSRTTGILATIAVASGLGLFRASDLTASDPGWLAVLLRVGLALVAVCMLIGLIHVWDVRPPRREPDEAWWRLPRKLLRWVRHRSRLPGEPPESDRRRHPFASSWLLTTSSPEDGFTVDGPDLLGLKVKAIRRIEHYRMQRAAIELHERNVEQQAGLERGQAWLGRAAFLAFLIAVLWLTTAR